jgi:septum site-determining protein MinC
LSSAIQVAEGDAPFQLRGNSFTMMVLKVIDPASPEFFVQLADKVRQSPNFFRNAPMVLDLSELAGGGQGFDAAAFVARVREHELVPLGFHGGGTEVKEAALAAGLVPMPPGRPARAETPRPAAEPRVRPVLRSEPACMTALVVTEPVRSGQQIYAEKRDLMVMAPVGSGAEVLADGHIHIYGPLRGRALAGIAGDTGARIFCQSLEAEVVSIAGLYRVSEDMDVALIKRPAQIWLKDGFLHMGAL